MMLGYWIETRYFAASIGILTPEQHALFSKLCQSKEQIHNRTHHKITFCDYLSKWNDQKSNANCEPNNDFWKEVNTEHSDCHTFINILPESAINISLDGFPPDFIKKKNRFNRTKGQCSPIFQNDTEENDWNLLNDFLELADATRGNYYKEQQNELPPVVSKEAQAEVQIINIDELRIAVYEGVLMAQNATDTDKWHILSKMKYKGKGWSSIARIVLDLEREKQCETKKVSKDEVSKRAREIQRCVESHRKYIFGIGTDEVLNDL